MKTSKLTIMKQANKFTNKDIIFILDGLRTMYNNATTDTIKTIIHMSFRNALYVISESRPADYISNEAQKIWIQTGITGDLHNLLVAKKRAIQNKHPELKQLVLEHCIPLSQLFYEFMEKDKNENYVLNNLKTAWITKNENNTLNTHYRSKRKNWKKCYAESRIILKK